MTAVKQSKLARHILDCVHDVQKIMGDIRSPVSLTAEHVQAAKALGLDEDRRTLSLQDRGRIVGFVYLNRLDVDNGYFDEIVNCTSIANSNFGSDVENALRKIQKCFKRVRFLAQRLICKPETQEEARYLENKLWEDNSQGMDEIVGIFEKQVEVINEQLRPFVSKYTDI